MRVVYDLLNSQGQKDQDDDAVLSLPGTTPAAAASSSLTTAVTDTNKRLQSRPAATKKDKNASSSSRSKTTSGKSSKMTSKTVKRRAEAIVDWLSSNGCASEVKIRSVVGDSPDTSKALRLLVKNEEVKRTGAGGRTDPFLYTVVSKETMQS